MSLLHSPVSSFTEPSVSSPPVASTPNIPQKTISPPLPRSALPSTRPVSTIPPPLPSSALPNSSPVSPSRVDLNPVSSTPPQADLNPVSSTPPIPSSTSSVNRPSIQTLHNDLLSEIRASGVIVSDESEF